jgi:PAS domain S-box-containing protein
MKLRNILNTTPRQGLVRIRFLLILLVAALVVNAVLYAGEAYALWRLVDWVVNLASTTISIISLLTVVAVWTLVSRLLKLPSVESLHEINLKLQNEISERSRAEEELQFHRDQLEDMVQTRTNDWNNTTLRLQDEVVKRQKAQEQVAFQASLIDQLESAILAGNQNREIVYWNQYAEKMFGWTKEEVLGRPLREVLLHPDQWNQHERRITQLTRHKRWEGDLRVIHKSGSSLPIHVSSTVLRGDNDQEIGFAFVCFDMSSQVRVQNKLQRAKNKAEKAVEAKQDFLSTMSHEIRTPLNVVIGMTRLLVDEDPKPEQLKYLKSLQFSANNLLVIINDILDFSKIEAGKVKLENINFSVSEVVQGVVQAFLFHAEEKGVDLKFEIDESLPERVVGDQTRLTQVLNNLVSNALKFTESGFVSIHVKPLNQSSERLEIAFDVLDTGIGISQDELPTIFNSFTQATSDTTRKFGGTGLGLTICKRLVELQNGTISASSRQRVGSKFTFVIPYQVAERLKTPPTTPTLEEYQLSGVQLLLVEDNSSNRMVATSFLDKMGVHVTIAENGAVAVEEVQRQDFDIVLMDLQMPQMDGYQATRAIRGLGSKYEQLPIIALTADVVSDAKDRVKQAGMNDYLSKPFNPDVLYRTISANLHLRVPSSPPDDRALTLQHLIEKYNDATFTTKLLDSLQTGFETLPRQVEAAVAAGDTHKLGRIMHKMLPTIQMVENAPLRQRLEELRTALSEGKISKRQLQPLLRAVCTASEVSLRYINTLSQRIKEQQENLTESS